MAGIFEVRDQAAVRRLLEPAGLEVEDGELLIEREILASGKSRAFVGSRPVAVALLKDLAPFLGDIHGQHDQQLLFSSEAQRDMLDAFAGNRELLDRGGAALSASGGRRPRSWRNWSATSRRSCGCWTCGVSSARKSRAPRCAPDEDTQLENERRVLQNVQKLQESAGTAYDAVYESPESAVALARIAAKRVEELYRIDASLEGLREHLKAAELSLQEAAYALRDYLSGLEANPGRLEEVENAAGSDRAAEAEVRPVDRARSWRFWKKCGGRLRRWSPPASAWRRCARSRSGWRRSSRSWRRELTEARKAAARRLEKRVEAELAQLAMERTVFRVAMTEAPWSAAGADRVEFLVSPNVGEEPRPLEKVASGGEISRIALALKTCLAGPKTSVVRTLVFDEVDTGVGGSAAEGVGRRLKKLAAANQVLCVTHLPQIASFADHHYRVEKQESRGRTVAVIEELDAAARTREVGRMLSGQKLTPEALKNAEQLIKMSAG